MDTVLVKFNAEELESKQEELLMEKISNMGKIIAEGGLVAFPTETVYGLGANALNGEAVAKIFRAKGRPADNPLIVHIENQKDLQLLLEQTFYQAHFLEATPEREQLQKLIQCFWPGPLTLVFPSSPKLPKEVTAGLNTVAVRVPNHPLALALIKAAGVPIAAPSANLSGKPSPISAEHVLEDLKGRIDAVIDGGRVEIGVESTVLDYTTKPPTLLRPGGVTVEALEDLLGTVAIDPALLLNAPNEKVKPRSPGMKYTHYAPEAQVLLVEGEPEQIAVKIRGLAQDLSQERKVGILATEENMDKYTGLPEVQVVMAGSRGNLATVAQGLYGYLRAFDQLGVDIILVEGYSEAQQGLAIMNRLRKASGYNIIKA